MYAPIPPDIPFNGAEMDLDSLDILLLVTSIEKEFGLKIPSEAVGREVFRNVGTLVRYIDDGRVPADLVGLTALESVEDLAAKKTSPANIGVLKKLDAVAGRVLRS